jgi:Na+-driven multidrug efflux pump
MRAGGIFILFIEGAAISVTFSVTAEFIILIIMVKYQNLASETLTKFSFKDATSKMGVFLKMIFAIGSVNTIEWMAVELYTV